MKKIGILTGGGDCPGLNAVIRGVVERCAMQDVKVFGYHEGWRGVIEQDGHWMDTAEVENIQGLGGTILRTSRTNVMKMENGPALVRRSMESLGLECIVAIGGDDTLGVANQLVELGLPMIGVPKTIDNDLNCTDYTFGFDTAANMAMRAMDDLCTTASSHSRVMVVEIMGRNTGWIAVQSAIAANVNVCVIPEFPLSLEEICRRVKKRYDEGKHYSIVALAEATRIKGLDEDLERLEKDSFGNYKYPERNIGQRLAEAIEEKTGLETRHIVLGHLQRSGAPTLFDRVLGTRLGVKAADLAMAHDYGKMVGLAGTTVVAVSLKEAVNMRKEVDAELYEIAEMCCR